MKEWILNSLFLFGNSLSPAWRLVDEVLAMATFLWGRIRQVRSRRPVRKHVAELDLVGGERLVPSDLEPNSGEKKRGFGWVVSGLRGGYT